MSHHSTAILTTHDYELLQKLMSTLIGSRSAFATILRGKLSAAAVKPIDDISADVVTLGSTVQYRAGDIAGQSAQARLVRGFASPDTLSILDPHGLALLGLKSGESISIPGSNGSSETLTVEAVLDQADSASTKSRRQDRADVMSRGRAHAT